jgi:SAM-dependent methyltransferase
VIGEAVATDISPGMLGKLERSAAELGLPVETAACEASELPFDDDSFELVFGHAVLHHVPDLDAAFHEFRRVLRPGGVVAFCGEPSLYGDRIAAWPKRGANAVAPLWRALMRAAPRPSANGHPNGTGEEHRLEQMGAAPRPSNANGNGGWSEEERLEQVVDVHAFTPAELSAHAQAAGFERVRVSGEELAASLFGWANRTLEASADPLDVPWAWRVYAYRGYLLLQTLDRSVLEPRLPAALFYNLLVSARAPG